jgi:hypothetical protein
MPRSVPRLRKRWTHVYRRLTKAERRAVNLRRIGTMAAPRDVFERRIEGGPLVRRAR